MDFLSAHEADLRGVPDPEVLALAGSQDRILVTHDFHTMPYHFSDFLIHSGRSPVCFSSAGTPQSAQ
jgi:hypothetical protein